MTAFPAVLWQSLGGWRTALVWRLFGWTTIQMALMQSHFGLGEFLTFFPWPYHLLWATGVALLIAGPRLLLLLLAALASSGCLWIALYRIYDALYFPAAEWPIHVGLPLVCSVMIVAGLVPFLRPGKQAAKIGGQEYRDEVDWVVTRVFRILFLGSMGFAAFHKLNADFFDPEVSCAGFTVQLANWWRLPLEGLLRETPPWVVAAAELLSPLLMLVAPGLGMIFAILLSLNFGSLGATVLATLLISTALGFLSAADVQPIREGLKRYRPWIAGSVVLAVVLSFLAHQAPRPWHEFGLLHGGTAFALWIAALALAARLRRRSSLTGPARYRPTAVQRGLLAATGLLLFVNGISPYLGLKFQYSFAMLSNLRVDDSRWNSLLIPRAVRLVEHDPYLHITRVRFFGVPDDEASRKRFLGPGLYLPIEVTDTLAGLYREQAWAGLEFRYRGQLHSFLEQSDQGELVKFLDPLRSELRLFQSRLVLDGPQSCVH